MKKVKHPIREKGSIVKFRILGDLDEGIALIVDINKEEGHYTYRLDVIEGSTCRVHRELNGELWVNDLDIVQVWKKWDRNKKYEYIQDNNYKNSPSKKKEAIAK